MSIQPEVMRQSEAPAGYNEAPCSSSLPHQVSLPSMLVFARHHASPLNHRCTSVRAHKHSPLTFPFFKKNCSLCLSVFAPLLVFGVVSWGLLKISHNPSSLLFSVPSPSSGPSLLPAGVLCNWAAVNSTLAWISSV